MFRGMRSTDGYETLRYAHEPPRSVKQRTEPITKLKEGLCGCGSAPAVTVPTLHPQQSEADRKELADMRSKAEKGDAQSQKDVGEVFQFGKLGVAKDEVEAVKWYHKAAEQNTAWAQFWLGFCYANGQGVAKDEVEAVKWYRKAAEHNFAPAQYKLSVCYHEGQGIAKDNLEAVKWWRKAAKQNLA